MGEPRWRELELARDRRNWWRRQLAQDVALWVFLGAVVLTVGLTLYRLDERSERLFALVAAERAARVACP